MRPLRLYIIYILLSFAQPNWAQFKLLSLPNQEQLSSSKIMHIIEDEEGFCGMQLKEAVFVGKMADKQTFFVPTPSNLFYWEVTTLDV